MTVDTYVRELDSYGRVAATEIVERAFTADSVAVCDLLGVIPPLNRFAVGVELVLGSVQALLRPHDDPSDALARLRDDFAQWGATPCRTGDGSGSPIATSATRWRGSSRTRRASLRELLATRHAALIRIGTDLAGLDAAGGMTATRAHVATSLAHLVVNRLLARPSSDAELWIHDVALRVGRTREALGTGPAS